MEDVLGEDAKCSYQRCLVALFANKVVGLANVYPSEEHLLTASMKKRLTSRSLEYLTPLFSFPLPHSFYISALASGEKGKGIGRMLIETILQMSLESGRDGITLHCWNDNASAMEFYRKLFFLKIKEFNLGLHPLIPYNGRISLLHRPIHRL